MTETVLVLDAKQRSALALTRALGKAGHTVITADDENQTLAGSSRHSAYSVVYPSAYMSPSQFIDFIIDFIKAGTIDVIYPMTEVTIPLVLSVRDEISLFGCRVPFDALETLEQLSNKCSLVKLAQKIGIAVPDTIFIYDPQTLSKDKLPQKYPLVFKPYKSRILDGNHWVMGTVKFVESLIEAADLLVNDPAFSRYPFMIQEKVKGQGQGVFVLYNHGLLVTSFAHKRLREKPPSGGVSVLCQSQTPSKTILESAKLLFDAVKFHGVAMAEFKVSPEGVPYLMEINARFWGSSQLAIDAGVNFPVLLHELTMDRSVAPIKIFYTKNKLRWFLGDLDRLYIILKSGLHIYPLKNKLLEIIYFLLPSRYTRHEINRISDLGPGIYEIKQYLKEILNRN